MEADLGEPDWLFGLSSYAFLADGRVLATWSEGGLSRLGILVPGTGKFVGIDTDLTSFGDLRPAPDGSFVVALAGSPTTPESVVRIAPRRDESADIEVVKRSRDKTVDPRYLSLPEPFEFPTEPGPNAYALYYAPSNADFEAPAGELPPLIVRSHGGPTSAAGSVLNYGIQFWTSRGFAVVDVNYGGSTGYGRAYRERLRGNWGVVDLDDCVNAALFLSGSGRADSRRLLIHGGSAGGYTTLCALTFRDVFAAGASYFGVADAGALARETHKFEARYLDSMIGPWPQARATYEERSPIFHTDQLHTPMILFQGLEDKVVPPAQAETMAEALAEKGVPYAYVAYEGEQHGFRVAENIRRTSEAELYFYARVLGFTPADDLRPVTIENETALEEAVTRGGVDSLAKAEQATAPAPARPRRCPGRTAALAGLGLLAVITAACGGSPTAGVAHIGSTTTAPAAAGSGGVPSPAHLGADLEKYSSCMRANGVANFPNPVISGQSVSLRLTPAIANSPKFNTAQAACQKYLPPGSAREQITPKDQDAYLKAAACMRSHGIVGFPDPVFSGGGVSFPLPKGMDPNSTAFLAAREICEMLIPAGLPFSKQAEGGK